MVPRFYILRGRADHLPGSRTSRLIQELPCPRFICGLQITRACWLKRLTLDLFGVIILLAVILLLWYPPHGPLSKRRGEMLISLSMKKYHRDIPVALTENHL